MLWLGGLCSSPGGDTAPQRRCLLRQLCPQAGAGVGCAGVNPTFLYGVDPIPQPPAPPPRKGATRVCAPGGPLSFPAVMGTLNPQGEGPTPPACRLQEAAALVSAWRAQVHGDGHHRRAAGEGHQPSIAGLLLRLQHCARQPTRKDKGWSQKGTAKGQARRRDGHADGRPPAALESFMQQNMGQKHLPGDTNGACSSCPPRERPKKIKAPQKWVCFRSSPTPPR